MQAHENYTKRSVGAAQKPAQPETLAGSQAANGSSGSLVRQALHPIAEAAEAALELDASAAEPALTDKAAQHAGLPSTVHVDALCSAQPAVRQARRYWRPPSTGLTKARLGPGGGDPVAEMWAVWHAAQAAADAAADADAAAAEAAASPRLADQGQLR